MTLAKLRVYWRVWWFAAKLSLARTLTTRTAAVLFILGKFFRFAAFIFFIFILSGQIPDLAGYDYQLLLVFFLVFNLFDIFGQFFFRGIYWFREQVVSGEFDFRLVKPLNPLFQALTRETDLLDLPLLVVVIAALVKQLLKLPAFPVLPLLIATGISLLCILSVHIFVAALGLLTTEVDHTMWVYRDLSLTARFPLDIYPPAIRGVLTYLIPIGLIFTFPAKAFLGLLSPTNLMIGGLLSFTLFQLTRRFWRYALTQYSSASS